MRIQPIKKLREFRRRLQNKDFRFAALLYLGAFSVFLLFIMPVVLTVSSNPRFCVACHSMNPEYQTWKRSSHAQISCYACHGSRSYGQLLFGKTFIDIQGPYKELTGRFEKPVNKQSHVSQESIPMERCERCHKNKNREFTFSTGIYIDHMAHKRAGINCTVCHNRVVHKGAEQFEPLKTWDAEFEYPDFLTMKQGCFRCHSTNPESRDHETMAKIQNGKVAPRACLTCHTGEFQLPVNHERPAWRSEHKRFARQDVENCMSCHSETAKFPNGREPWCTRCHDRDKVESIIGRSWEGRNTDPDEQAADHK